MQRYDLVLCSIECGEMTLEDLATRAGMHPDLLEQFVEFGLIQPVATRGTVKLFHGSETNRLQSIRRLRQDLGINLAGIAVVLDLLEHFRNLETELAGLRARL
jgi:DNA-binding transcriptional MerR regulator